MPFPVGSAQFYYEAVTSAEVPIEVEHQAGDVLILSIEQDVGTGTISIAGGGWNEPQAQAAANGQRLAVFWKYAASSLEANVTINSTLNDDIGVVLTVLRGVHQTTAVVASAKSNTAASEINPVSPAFNANQNNCLVIHSIGYDGQAMRIRAADRTKAVCLKHVTPVGTAGSNLAVCWANHPTSGAVQQVTFKAGPATNEGGTIISIAFADDGQGRMAPMPVSLPTPILEFGDFYASHDATISTVAAADDLAATTILSLGLSASAPAAASTHAPSDDFLPWTGSIFTTAENNGVSGGQWSGYVHTLTTAVSLVGCLVGLLWGINATSAATTVGAQGAIIVFEDTDGDWVAFQLGQIQGTLPFASRPRQWVCAVESQTPAASGGTMNWANVKKIGFLYHRQNGTTAARSLTVRNLWKLAAPVQIAGGSAASPINGAFFKQAVDGWTNDESLRIQGSAQLLSKIPIQFGGTGTSVASIQASALEFPLPRNNTFTGFQNQLPAETLEVRLKPLASDVFQFGSAVMATSQRHRFVIDSGSSPSANVDFSGLVLAGFEVDHLAAGLEMNRVTFSRCYTITLQGNLTDCSVVESLSSPAILTADPSLISGCRFVAHASGGHAIEITAPGTYTFAANTFEGYGANGTTDAAIYNNSGGAVTINVTNGGDTPTVRNGSGASTTVNSGATLTLTGLQTGSDIVILDAGTTTERINVNAHSGTTYAYNYTAGGDVDIGVFKVGFVPRYIRGYTLGATDASLPVTQTADRSYSNP